MVSANTIMKAAIKRLDTVEATSGRKRRKKSRTGNKARNSAPRLAPNIQARDQMSRADQPAGDVPRVATTSPENPASATAIWAIANRNPWLSIHNAG